MLRAWANSLPPFSGWVSLAKPTSHYIYVFSCQEAVTGGWSPTHLHRLPATRTLCSVLSPVPGCADERGVLSPWDGTWVCWIYIISDRCRAKGNRSAPWVESLIPAVGFAKMEWDMAGVKKQNKWTNNSEHSLFSMTPSVFSIAKHGACPKPVHRFSHRNAGVQPPEESFWNSKRLHCSPAQSLPTPSVTQNRFFSSSSKLWHLGFGAVASCIPNNSLLLKVKIWLFSDDLKLFLN